MSIEISLLTCNFASVTYLLPGPNILKHFGIDSVPYAIAKIAWEPPTLYTFLIFSKSATHNIVGFIFPFLSGGVQITIFGQPAIIAGIACIRSELNSGAVPPGIYNPTLSIGLNSDHKETPFVVSILLIDKPSNCFSWYFLIFEYAVRMAFFNWSSTNSLAFLNSELLTLNDLISFSFKILDIFLKPLSPSSTTSFLNLFIVVISFDEIFDSVNSKILDFLFNSNSFILI